MITKSSPSEIEWVTGPLPDPDTVHPDCEIVIWYDQLNDGNFKIFFLKSKVYVPADPMILGSSTYTQYKWFCNKGYVWHQNNNNIQCWGWWKHFR